jgi:cytochrome c556
MSINQREGPSLSDESRSLVQDTLGDRMKHFAGFDQLVHGYADSIKQSAVENDISSVLEHYQIVQQGCVNCHTAFQEEIREARLSR